MKPINWAIYSDKEFEAFCNALLSLELGRAFHPFSAPGKDRGIDGWFEGEYSGKQGKWRFQYKFHNVARKNGVALLKNDLRSELAKSSDEDYFILLSNVELNPQELNEFLSIDIPGKVRFEIWDGAKLFTLYIRHPLLDLWMTDGFQTAQVQLYTSILGDKLNQDYRFPQPYGNYFIARNNELYQLSDFLSGSQLMASVVGDAGIGKTRLVLEFFKTLNQNGTDWLPLMLASRTLDFDKINRAFPATQKFVILIDDAHTYHDQVISDLNRLAASRDGNLKVILTSRLIVEASEFSLVKEYDLDKIVQIELKALTRKETIEFFKHEIKNPFYINHIDELAEISFGKPLMIVEIMRAVMDQRPISQIKDEQFLNKYVFNHFRELIKKSSDFTDASAMSLWALLRLLCLIEPVNYSNLELRKKISNACSLEEASVQYFLNELVSKNYVSGRFEQSIKPDYYSDILLTGFSAEKIGELWDQFAESLDNVIINLSSASGQSKESFFLESILQSYIKRLADIENPTQGDKILKTVLAVVHVRPQIAADTIELFLKTLEKKDHPAQHIDRSLLYNLLSQLLYYRDRFEFVFWKSYFLYSLYSEQNLLNSVYGFSKRDVIENFSFERQLFFINKTFEILLVADDNVIKFVLNTVPLFLKLDFDYVSPYGNARHEITIVQYYISEIPSVVELRRKATLALEIVYRTSKDEVSQNASFLQLLGIPGSILATKRNPTRYQGIGEQEHLLRFFSDVARDLNSGLKKELLQKLYWFRQWKMDVSLYPLLDKVEESLVPENLTEKIVQLFSKYERAFSHQLKTEFKTDSEKIIEDNNGFDLATAVTNMTKGSLQPFHLLPGFLYFMASFSQKNKDFYVGLKKLHKDLFYQYADIFLQQFHQNDPTFFEDEVKTLEQENSGLADNVLLRFYGNAGFKDGEFSKTDTRHIKGIANKKDPQNHYDLLRALQLLIKYDPKTAKSLCIQFLQRCDDRQAATFFMFLDNNEYVPEALFEELLLKHTDKFDISYELEHGFNRLLKNKHYEKVAEYLIGRFKSSQSAVSRNIKGYRFSWIPAESNSDMFVDTDRSVRLFVFSKLLSWYVELKVDDLMRLMAARLVGYCAPPTGIDELYATLYQDKFQEVLESQEKLLWLIQSLSVFHVKDRKLIKLIITFYETAVTHYNSNSEMLKQFRYRAYEAITTVGVKSGVAGEPFPVDIELRDLIKEEMESLTLGSISFNYLNDVLRSVENEISNSLDKDNETW